MMLTGDGDGGSDKAWPAPRAYRSDAKTKVGNRGGRVLSAQRTAHISTALPTGARCHPIPQKTSRGTEIGAGPQLHC